MTQTWKRIRNSGGAHVDDHFQAKTPSAYLSPRLNKKEISMIFKISSRSQNYLNNQKSGLKIRKMFETFFIIIGLPQKFYARITDCHFDK